MKQFLLCIFLTTTSFCYAQNFPESNITKYIDSAVYAINLHNNTLLKKCDSIADIDDNKIYKCWNYYFLNTSKNKIVKISISFNNLPEELCFYYENDKVIRRDEYKIKRGHYKSVWSVYFKDDKEIYYKGKNPERRIGYDKTQFAYYLLYLAYHE